MRKIATAFIAVSAMTLSACGATESAAPPTTKKPATTTTSTTTTTTTTTSTTTTVAVTTTTLSPQQLAQADYFYILTEISPLEAAIDEKFDGKLTWCQYSAYCGERANVRQRFGQLLANTLWPPLYQPQVTDVITKNSAFTQLYFTCADLPGTEVALYPIQQRVRAALTELSAAVTTLRGVLGLPIER
jgi:hypothetical protein